jgi:hypothetical protein
MMRSLLTSEEGKIYCTTSLQTKGVAHKKQQPNKQRQVSPKQVIGMKARLEVDVFFCEIMVGLCEIRNCGCT